MKHKPKKRFRILELKDAHVIDACVIFGSTDPKYKYFEDCKKYLSALSHKYKGYTTVPLLGDIFLAILNFKDVEIKSNAIDFMQTLMDRKMLNIVTCDNKEECKKMKLFELNNKMEHMDACHISNTIHNKIKYFITTDAALVDPKNEESKKRIYDEYKLYIKSPKEMIFKLDIR